MNSGVFSKIDRLYLNPIPSYRNTWRGRERFTCCVSFLRVPIHLHYILSLSANSQRWALTSPWGVHKSESFVLLKEFHRELEGMWLSKVFGTRVCDWLKCHNSAIIQVVVTFCFILLKLLFFIFTEKSEVNKNEEKKQLWTKLQYLI